MKNNIKFGLLLIIIGFAALLSSCDSSLALGTRLNLDGPVVTLMSPKARQPVDGQFYMMGNVSSNNPVRNMRVRATVPPSIDDFLIKQFDVEWEYTTDNGWKLSLDGGVSWDAVPDLWLTELEPDPDDPGLFKPVQVLYKAEWNGSANNASWILPVDMLLLETELGKVLGDGQYTFTVTAWDTANNSDDRSYQTVSVIVDKTNPFAEVIVPRLYEENTDPDFVSLKTGEIRDPGTLGMYMNGRFNMQYLIKAINEVWSLDIRIYEEGDVWENSDGTLSNDYVYRMNINEANEKPQVPDSSDMVRPTGRLLVDLTKGAEDTWFEGRVQHHLKKPIGSSGKKYLFVVLDSISFSGVPIDTDERFQGFFVYWPETDRPWIEFPSGLETSFQAGRTPQIIPHKLFPSSIVGSRAYDDDGVSSVSYKIYQVDDGNWDLPLTQQPVGYPVIETIIGNRSRVFSWRFPTPTFSGKFKIEAEVFENPKIHPDLPLSSTRVGYFEVEDASFPEVRVPDKPWHSVPLYNFIEVDGNGDWYIDIEGKALADSGISKVEMVWINPHSLNYAAMSQLAFFREANYVGTKETAYGWKSRTASDDEPVAGFLEDPGIDKAFDDDNPNKLWNLRISSPPVVDAASGRRMVTYSKRLYLKKDLNIAPGRHLAEDGIYDYLKSQVFVFKATDINEKSSMLTWAPQGDTEAPRVVIDEVRINNELLNFTDPEELDSFKINDRIFVKGRWREDSAFAPANLNILQTILKTNLKIRVGDYELNGSSLTDGNRSIKTITLFTAPDGQGFNGEWVAEAIVGADDPWVLQARRMVDTLVVTSIFTDLGGNISEAGYSWLIKSDRLRFTRIGSETPDDLYSTHKDGQPVKINIYLEFNKSVMPVNTGNLPALVLNNGAIAIYDTTRTDQWNAGAPVLSSRQNFIYTVQPGDDTDSTAANALNVHGLEGVTLLTDHTDPSYRYVWEERTRTEKVWLTLDKNDRDVGLAKLPVADTITSAPGDSLFTLRAGKTIRIDTQKPLLKELRPSIRGGWYNQGNVLYVTMEFDEAVQLGSTMPRLVTNIKNKNGPVLSMPMPNPGPAGYDSYDELEFIQVSDKSIIFSFPVTLGDSIDDFKELIIDNLTGVITDLAGNEYEPLPADFPVLLKDNANNFIYVHAMDPPPPEVRIYSENNRSALIGSSNYVWESNAWVEKLVDGKNASAEWNPNSIIGGFTGFLATPDTLSGGANYIPKVRLNNVYVDSLFIELVAAGVEGDDWDRIEYSVDYGQNWTSALNAELMSRENLGNYVVTARQIDKAGNESAWSKPITLNWNQGALLTRISSSKPNGVYTNNKAIGGSREDDILITLSFRLDVKFNVNPVFELNVEDYTNPTAPVKVYVSVPSTGTDSWSGKTLRTFDFRYYVKGFDSTSDKRLNVEKIWVDNGSGVLRELQTVDVQDEFGTYVGNMVRISGIEAKPPVRGSNLEDNKDIRIAYGRPRKISGPSFTEPMLADDLISYEMDMEVEYDRNIWTNGSNSISIIQTSDGYRLPAVLTKAMGDRYRALLAAATPSFNFDKYYTEGVNGFEAITGGTTAENTYGGSPDNTVKYILNFEHDPYSIKANSASALEVERFAEALRKAEAITVAMSSSAVTVQVDTIDGKDDHKTLKVSLRGANALRVLGAEYEVVYLADMVRDQFGNPCESYNSSTDTEAEDIKTPGIDRAFIRIEKVPETITRESSGSNQPVFEVDWTGTTRVRMDCRTPGSRVRWSATTNKDEWYPSSVTPGNTDIGWTFVANNNENLPPVFGVRPANNTRYRNPALPADPNGTIAATLAPTNSADGRDNGTYGTTDGQASSPITIGEAATTRSGSDYDFGSLFHGYRWRVRARGMVGTSYSSVLAEEIAYRSAFTFTGNNINMMGGSSYGGENFQDGDQLWIRGGNTMSGSNIPGFPLSTMDNWAELQNNKQRAGIRLMKKTAGSTLETSTWQWVTWEMNATAYVTLFLGRDWYFDEDNVRTEYNTPATQVRQYGPRRSAFQDGEWTLLKEFYSIFPGSHRFMISNRPSFYGSGSNRVNPFNFNKSFYERPSSTLSVTWPPVQL